MTIALNFYFNAFEDIKSQVDKVCTPAMLQRWMVLSHQLYDEFEGHVSWANVQRSLGVCGLDVDTARVALQNHWKSISHIEDRFPNVCDKFKPPFMKSAKFLKIYYQLNGEEELIKQYLAKIAT